jgi:hypothetical protein
MSMFNCFEYEHIYQQIKEQICTDGYNLKAEFLRRKESNNLKGQLYQLGKPTI